MTLRGFFAYRRSIVAAAGVFLVGVVTFLYWPSTDPWKPTTVPRTAECGAGCRVIGEVDTGHELGLRLTEQPNVDDAVAQWADCLTSIRSCYERDGSAAFVGCVAKAACPAICRKEFARRTDGKSDPLAILAAYEATFLADDAKCLARIETPKPGQRGAK